MGSNFKTIKKNTLWVLLALLLVISFGITVAVKITSSNKSPVSKLVIDSADDAIRN